MGLSANGANSSTTMLDQGMSRLFTQLPTDVFCRITRYLTERDIIYLTQVNRYFYKLSQDEALWYHLLRRKFGRIVTVKESCRLAFLKSRGIPSVNADAFECSAVNGRFGISPLPLCLGDPLLTIHYSPDFSVTATFQLVPAGEYRVVWQLYLTPESAGLRNICFGSVVYWRNRLVTRQRRYYHPPENTWQCLPRDQLVQVTVPDRLIVSPDDEYTKVVVKCYSVGSNWKINLALHSVALRAV